MNTLNTIRTLTTGVALCAWFFLSACLEPQRFELDVNSPDGLLSFGLSLAVSPTSTDSTTPVYEPSFSTTTPTVREGDTAQTYTVKLTSQPTANVDIGITNLSSALSVSPGALTFTSTNWNIEQTVTLTGVDNQVRTNSTLIITLTHALTSTDTNYSGQNATVTVSLQDNDKYIFLTGAAYTGAGLGGLAGADTICNTHGSRPDTSVTYKAMIVGRDNMGTIRRACSDGECNCGTTCSTNQGLNWVLAANTGYLRSDGTTYIGKTTAAAIFYPFPLSNAPLGTFVQAWTGMDSGWRTPANSQCEAGGNSWTASAGNAPLYGTANSTTGSFIFGGGGGCLDTRALYCVEQ